MRPTRKLVGPLAVALSVTPLAAPVALAHAADHMASRPAHSSQRPKQDLRSPDTRDAAEGRTTADTPAPVVVTRPLVEVTSDGFDWTDAGIGAGAATGLIAISLAGAMTSRRRSPRSKPATS
jgi:hypothetical protein